MTYLLSDARIQRQISNNKYPIITGGEIDLAYNESKLNKELNSMISSIKKLTKK